VATLIVLRRRLVLLRGLQTLIVVLGLAEDRVVILKVVLLGGSAHTSIVVVSHSEGTLTLLEEVVLSAVNRPVVGGHISANGLILLEELFVVA